MIKLKYTSSVLQRLVVVVVLAMAFLPSGADASSDMDHIELTPEEQAWLEKHSVIRVHNEKDWAPFNYFEYGNPQGLSIDYMNLLAEKLGIKVEYITGPSWHEFFGHDQTQGT